MKSKERNLSSKIERDEIADLITCELEIPFLNRKGVFFYALIDDLRFLKFKPDKEGHLWGKIEGKFFVGTKGIGETEEKIINCLIKGKTNQRKWKK